MFYSTEPHYCPKCLPKEIKTRSGKIRIERNYLELVEENYSGCGTSIAQCQICRTCFEISYKIDEVRELDWT